jgi:flagellar protein FliO/FliZ
MGSGAGQLAQTALALLVVIAVILALSWLARRVQGLRAGQGGALKVRAALSLGARERMVWVQAGETHLLVGVAPGRVQTLHVFDTPPQIDDAQAAPSFAELLQKARGRSGAPTHDPRPGSPT